MLLPRIKELRVRWDNVLVLWILIFNTMIHAIPGDNSVWTAWSDWGKCSFTCGKGVRSRYRECVGHSDTGLVRLVNPTCPGNPMEYMICENQPCPLGEEENERERQCNERNADVVLGALYHWIPFYGGPNPCMLTCLARGFSFYYNFGHVKDGTPCKKDSDDLCVRGLCSNVGCDGVVGSNARVDDCGICGGENENCSFFKRTFDKLLPNSGVYGYNEILKVPAGSTKLKVVDNSNNYLALADVRRTYIINGNWKIDWPGRYEIAGTTIYYGRSGPDNETITAEGPILEDLYLMIIFREKNRGVTYQFWLPKDKLLGTDLNLIPMSYNKPDLLNKTNLPSFSKNTIDEKHSYHYSVYNHSKKSAYERSYNRMNIHQKNHPRERGHQKKPKKVKDKSSKGTKPGFIQNQKKIVAETKSKYSPRTETPNNDVYNSYEVLRKQSKHGVSKTQEWLDALKLKRSRKNPPKRDPRLRDGRYRALEAPVEDIITLTPPSSGHFYHVPMTTATPEVDTPRIRPRDSKRKRKNKVMDDIPDYCGKCPQSKNKAKHFCSSQFAVHLEVLDIEEIEGRNDTRIDVQIKGKYKDSISLLNREYLWVPNMCKCPYVKENKEYIVMGSLVTDPVSKEGRLQLEKNSFVRQFSRKNDRRMKKLLERNICDRHS